MEGKRKTILPPSEVYDLIASVQSMLALLSALFYSFSTALAPEEVLGFATPDGDFPIHIAAKWGQVEAVRVLLEHGADLCQRDAQGRTVVHWAAANSASTLKELSTEAAFSKAVTVQDEFGCSPLALAIREANVESTKILMGSAATTTTGPSPLLTVLSAMEYSEALGNCLEVVVTIQPSVVEQVDETGKCVLHLQLNKRVLMKVLKHSYASVNLNLQDTEGQTPLHMAVSRGMVNIRSSFFLCM
ncbi:ankyrin repeat protein [Ancylostoma caninum]|uniref:Ankyrin repeat protein n=1 Tax=Ancylostoma caninum TaxID=29170 RepID=A0A368EZT6_ANCCA|nr:ankyrin repeat protein [Ancylostoma caninum]